MSNNLKCILCIALGAILSYALSFADEKFIPVEVPSSELQLIDKDCRDIFGENYSGRYIVTVETRIAANIECLRKPVSKRKH